MTDQQLIQAIQDDLQQFGLVYDRHYDTIFNYCYKRTKDFDNSRDITAETFLKAYLNISKFKWRGIPILSWLYRIAINEIKLFYRSKKYRPKLLSELNPHESFNLDQLKAEKSTAEQEMEQHTQFLQVQKAIHSLPLKYQEVITLKYFEKLKIKEICIILNKKEGTVKSLLSRGVSKLKKQF